MDPFCLISSALAAETAVGVTGRLLGLVVASALEVGFGVVLLDPGDDMFGIE